MNLVRRIFAKPAAVALAAPEDEWPGPGRKLRTFDIEMIAPYDAKALVAFLRADAERLIGHYMAQLVTSDDTIAAVSPAPSC